MTERTYSEEDIAKVMEFYNTHKHNKTYREMAYEYGICPSKFYYIVKKGLKKTQTKKRDIVLSHIAKTIKKYDRCSIKATAYNLKISRKQIEKWLFDAGYEASIAGGFIFSTKYINKIVKMYESGIPVDEIIAGTTPTGLHDIPAMQKLIDNNIPVIKEEASRKKVYTQEEIQGCIDLVDSGTSVKETARTTHIPESTIRGWINKENKKPRIIEVSKEYADAFVHTEDGYFNRIPLKTKKEWSKLKSVNEAVVPFKKDGDDSVSVLGECVEHKTGDTIKTQPTLQIKLGEIEHKIAELNEEIKKLEGYRETLKQSIMILSMVL